MATKNEELLKKLLATFRVEADEHLQGMSSGLLALEKTPAGEERAALVEKIFREAHSLKGAARAVNLLDVESLCHSLESVFAGLKGGRIAVSPPLFDLLHQALDALGGLLAPGAGALKVRSPAIESLARRLDDASKGSLPEPEARAEAAVAAGLASGTVRVSTAKLDALMRQVEELLTPRLAAGERARELRETAAALAARTKERARIQPALPQLAEYLDAEQLFTKTIEDRLARLGRSAEQDRRALAGMTDSLLRDVKEMHLLPFSSLLEIVPRFVRDFARDQGKEVELAVQGGEIEIDRRILEEMKDPLIHLLRNCIDHGIEKPAAREEKRKPPHGTIELSISQQDGGKVELLVADDGAGIDAAGVTAAARKLGMVSEQEAQKLGAQEALALVFRSGISTSPIITDASGRGLGLAIVREKVERLGGAVAIESRPGAGTRFRIVLPLTLATFRGVLVRVGERLFVIPAASVERVTRAAEGDVRTVENRETIPLDGRAVSLVRLGDALELPGATASAAADSAPAVVLGAGPERVAFRVDEVLGEQEVLVKALGPQLARVRNVAGACVLGTGQVAPVLNVPDLMKSAVKRAAAPLASAAAQGPAAAQQRSILVAEDSITSRALLKNILESAGYRVVTAVDGIEAYTALKTGTFDLVVSDVEMPRMDGFDLTAKIRADRALAEMPVVLVTALESREHRERGVDAGASAYIVKSSFDQSNLLDIVRRLL